ncbi:hypothetical protein R3W88_031449 [Solanum pinnatisectum]|uniref:DUF4283 domain-containing protein n=1 Tax=Solanum pinnatisectum TaxID=50273 RepID=A0AAV9LLD2_9SOLN|nr:hypothetical protein R3W88_031449 [Solanum pinnatisectum]
MDGYKTQSFKKALLDRSNTLNQSYDMFKEHDAMMDNNQYAQGAIPLTKEDKLRLYQPWCVSVIVKAFGKRLSHDYLKNKITNLWKLNPNRPQERLSIAKFSQVQSMSKILHEGPWFVAGQFLSVKRWEPNFIPHQSTITHIAIWASLPQLPTEFYDKTTLEKVGQRLGTLLKIDTCTSATLRGRYARIYIQVPLEEPIKTKVIIGSHKQKVVYEGEGVMCVGCGRIGHTLRSCTTTTPNNTPMVKGQLQLQQPKLNNNTVNGKLSRSRKRRRRMNTSCP